MIKKIRSNGKLLITGEYFVLDGALSFALPTKRGQVLEIHKSKNPDHFIDWTAYDVNQEKWFFAELDEWFNVIDTNISESAGLLSGVLKAARLLNQDFLREPVEIKTKLEFPNNWGLGSSSTFINNIAQWAEVNPFHLFFKSFAGSGYDIACANSQKAILYRLKEGSQPQFEELDFNPKFKNQLYFVHLNQKKNSREGISHYRNHRNEILHLVDEISELSMGAINAKSFEDFAEKLEKHELLIAEALKMELIKKSLFPDFDGFVKSLGAWGGDFVLCGSPKESEYVNNYFNSKNFSTIVPFDEMIIHE